MDEEYLKLFVQETSFYNDIVLASLLPERWWAPLPHFFRGWLRNYIGGTLLYFISGFLWCLYIYHLRRNVYVPKDAIPSNKAMLLQIYVAMKAMPWYTLLPTLSEHMIENGRTKCFSRISDVGWLPYLLYLSAYLVFVEFGIYWMHRELHDIKPLYKYLHATHHIYNKQNTLSPFAELYSYFMPANYVPFGHLFLVNFNYQFHVSNNKTCGKAGFPKMKHIQPYGLAFHPLDGILQAVPHVVALFLLPMHFTTHIALLFMEAVWTANIHDCIHGKIWPVMGAGYHTIHHTTYRHNYGHYTIWMDWMFNTLRDPEEDEAKKP